MENRTEEEGKSPITGRFSVRCEGEKVFLVSTPNVPPDQTDHPSVANRKENPGQKKK